jgi:biotin---protein ligase
MYNVNVEQMRGSAWQKSTALVVVHGNIPENVAPVLISYLVAGKIFVSQKTAPLYNRIFSGGKVLSIASNLIFVPYPELKTCEVQLSELGTFSYQKWKTIRLLHHIYYK